MPSPFNPVESPFARRINPFTLNLRPINYIYLDNKFFLCDFGPA